MTKKLILSAFITACFLGSGICQNVGIGTTTPTRAKLEVEGAVDATSAIFGGESSGISLQRNWPGIGYNTYYSGGNRYLATGYAAKEFLDPNSGYLYLDMLTYGTAGSIASSAYRAFAISSSGNIGLGGGAPNGQLQLSNTLENRKLVLWESADNDHQYFGLGIESGTMRYAVAGTNNVHRFYAGDGANSSDLLMSIWGDKNVLISDLNGGGKLGINLASSPATLSVRQAGGTGIYIQEAASGTNWEFRAGYTAATQYAVLYLRHQGADVGWFRPSGEYFVPSDRRLKASIEPIPPTLEKLLQLQPKMYELKANNPRHEKTIGFVAQEVKPLFPELVVVNENLPLPGMENLHAVNYAGFSVLAVKAIQEQQVQIDTLKKEVDLLKEQNKMLLQVISKK